LLQYACHEALEDTYTLILYALRICQAFDYTGAANVSDTVVETTAAGGLLFVRARARPLPAASAAGLEEAAHLVDVLRRSPDPDTVAGEAHVREQLDTLRERLAAGADDAKVCEPYLHGAHGRGQ
jgi:hypothetical protein